MGIKKRDGLFPRTSSKAITQSRFIEGEVRDMLNKAGHVKTTKEYREWLVRQAIKKGKV